MSPGGKGGTKSPWDRRGAVSPRRAGWGWCNCDSLDGRDRFYATGIGTLSASQAKKTVNLRAGLSPVHDQGGTYSCVGHAVVGALEHLQRTGGPAIPNTHLSPLFIYYNARTYQRPNFNPLDGGCCVRDALKALSKLGVCSASLWPWNAQKVNTKPEPGCYTAALEYLESLPIFYWRIRGLAEMRDCLARGYPFVSHFFLDPVSFKTVNETGEVQLKDLERVAKLLNGHREKLAEHSALAVGYDDKKAVFTVRNSKGAAWGDGGYFTIPYAYLDDDHVCPDSWTIRRTDNLAAP